MNLQPSHKETHKETIDLTRGWISLVHHHHLLHVDDQITIEITTEITDNSIIITTIGVQQLVVQLVQVIILIHPINFLSFNTTVIRSSFLPFLPFLIASNNFRATAANARDSTGNEIYPGCNGTVCLPLARLCAVRKEKGKPKELNTSYEISYYAN